MVAAINKSYPIPIMTRQTYDFEIITPCFCAGANPAEAEIRAPSIRGQLRWWFRVLGGSAAEEASVFGSVAGDTGAGSALRIAIANFQKGPIWPIPVIDQNKAENYTWHFAAVSGTVEKGKLGPRWKSQGSVPPGSTFKLMITQLRPIDPLHKKRFELARDAFLCFGTIGLRATRGLGAFDCKQAKPWRELLADLSREGFAVAVRQNPEPFTTWEAALKDWSAWLRYKFRKEFKADRFSALGGIRPRQASAIRFRPVRLPSGQLTWVALEAPHRRVLLQSTLEIITPSLLTGPAPTAPPPKRR